MSDKKPSNNSATGELAITAAFFGVLGLLVSMLIGILRLRKRVTPAQDSGLYPGITAARAEYPVSSKLGKANNPPEETAAVAWRENPPTPPAISMNATLQPVSTTRWSSTTKYLVGTGLFLALCFVVYLSRSSLGMIIFAALIAFIVNPLIRYFQKRLKLKRGLSIIFTYLLVVATLIIIPLIVIPAIVNAINDVLSLDWQSIGQSVSAWLENAALNATSIPVVGGSLAEFLQGLSQAVNSIISSESAQPVTVDVSIGRIGGGLSQMLGRLASVLGPLISAVTSLVFMLLISLHMSLSTDMLREAYPKLIPPAYEGEVSGLISRIFNIWTSFLRGQLSLMVIMGVLTYLLNLLLGTPFPLFLGFIAGLLEVIPNLGPVLATIPAVLLALMFGSTHFEMNHLVFALIVILGYVLLSLVENQVIVPYVLGDAVNLPPLVVIIGCVVGGSVFGLLGVFLATPVISTGKEVFNYLYNKILEPPAVEEPPEAGLSWMDSFRRLAGRIRLPFRKNRKSLAESEKIGGSNPPSPLVDGTTERE